MKNLIKRLLPYRPIRVSGPFWEKRYKEGAWDRIRSIDELARYSIIVGYTHFLYRGDSCILDVGCGEGILYERFSKDCYSRYLGIDVSKEAIGRGYNKNEEKHQFITARIEDFKTEEKFDVVIFNECLYYLEKPIEILELYEGFLSKNGLFIVSMNSTAETWKIWKQIDKHYIIRDAVSVSNAKGVSWMIKVIDVR